MAQPDAENPASKIFSPRRKWLIGFLRLVLLDPRPKLNSYPISAERSEVTQPHSCVRFLGISASMGMPSYDKHDSAAKIVHGNLAQLSVERHVLGTPLRSYSTPLPEENARTYSKIHDGNPLLGNGPGANSLPKNQTLLNYLLHLVVLDPETRLVADGLKDSVELAKQNKISWVNDIRLVLSRLPVPIYWDLSRADALSKATVEGLLKSLTTSTEEYIQASILSYSKTRDLFAQKLEMVDKKLVKKVLFFRHYLRVSNEKHGCALTQILLSGHALASEHMMWADRDRPEAVPDQ
ncbi:hypothetical protein C8R45DRAFT_932136 [Mycena sanguinolenta]|nr:hypothetical protein C8R45DRAFT_932136 [Mycena sanguinolenta]